MIICWVLRSCIAKELSNSSLDTFSQWPKLPLDFIWQYFNHTFHYKAASPWKDVLIMVLLFLDPHLNEASFVNISAIQWPHLMPEKSSSHLPFTEEETWVSAYASLCSLSQGKKISLGSRKSSFKHNQQ